MESLRKLKVKTLDNQTYSLEVGPEISIKDLKVEIEKVTKVPNDKQRLIYRGKMLVDDSPLSSYVTEDDQTIHMLARTVQPEQGEQSAPQNQPNTQQNSQSPNSQMNFPIPNGQNIVITATNMPFPLGQPINNILGNLIQASTNPNIIPFVQGNQIVTIRGPQGQTITQSIPIVGQNNPTQNSQTQSSTQQTQPNNQNVTQNRSNISASPITTETNNTTSTSNNVGTTATTTSTTSGSTTTQQQQPSNSTSNSQTSQQRVLIELPHQHVHNIGVIVNNFMGINSSFPGPVMPQLGLPRNNLSLLGGFLYSYQFQILRLLPFLSRLADLLQRESQMNNPQDRLQTQLLANQIGKALTEIVLATAPVMDLFRNLHIGERPGEFRLPIPGNNVQQQHIHHQLQQQQQQQRMQGSTNSSNLPTSPSGGNMININPLGGMVMPGQMNLQSFRIQLGGPGIQGQQQTQQLQQTQQSQQSHQQQQQLPNTGTINTSTSQNTVLSTSSSEQQTQGGGSHQQSEPIRSTSLQSSNIIQSHHNAQAQSQHQQSNRLDTSPLEDEAPEPNPQTQTLSELFLANRFNLTSEATGNQYVFLNNYRNEIKQGYRKLLQKYGDPKLVASKFTLYILKLLDVPEKYASKVLEGFEPKTVAGDILENRILQVLHIVETYKDVPNARFSDLVGSVIYNMIGEVVCEISEGLTGGFDDFKEIFRENFKNSLRSVFRQSDHHLEAPLNQLLWYNLESAYTHRTAFQHQMQAREKAEKEKAERERALIAEIEEALNLDAKEQESQPDQKLSESYRKGDL